MHLKKLEVVEIIGQDLLQDPISGKIIRFLGWYIWIHICFSKYPNPWDIYIHVLVLNIAAGLSSLIKLKL